MTIGNGALQIIYRRAKHPDNRSFRSGHTLRIQPHQRRQRTHVRTNVPSQTVYGGTSEYLRPEHANAHEREGLPVAQVLQPLHDEEVARLAGLDLSKATAAGNTATQNGNHMGYSCGRPVLRVSLLY